MDSASVKDTGKSRRVTKEIQLVIVGLVAGVIASTVNTTVVSHFENKLADRKNRHEVFAKVHELKEKVRSSLYFLIGSKVNADYFAYRYQNLTPGDPSEKDQQWDAVNQSSVARSAYSQSLIDLFGVLGSVQIYY